MEASVRLLCLNKVGVHTHLRAEHFVKWLWEAYLAEGASAPPNQEWWQKLVAGVPDPPREVSSNPCHTLKG